MVDGIKCKSRICEISANRITKKLNLTIHKGYRSANENEVAGRENSYKRTGKYKCFEVEVERNGNDYFLTVRGSLHKYYHGNNAGSFTGFEILEAIRQVCTYFDIDERECVVYHLEVGINIPVWFDVYGYLKNNLIQHKKERFKDIRDSKRFGFEATHDDYLIKLYRKLNDLLRYEIKLTSRKKISQAGIYTLADINKLHINGLANDLVDQWQEIISRDGLNIYDRKNRFTLLAEKDRERILEFTSIVFIQSYQDKLSASTSQAQLDQLRQEAYRLKKYCLGIIKKHGNGDHSKLYQLIYDGVENFKQSWDESKGEMSRFPSLVKWGIRDNSNIMDTVEQIKSNSGKETANKIKNNMKGNKQIAIDKRELKKSKIKSFMGALQTTLERMDNKPQPVVGVNYTSRIAA